MNKDLSEEDAKKLQNWYLYYHKLATSYKWKYKRLKKQKLTLNMSSIALTVIASLSITGDGAVIQGYLPKSDIVKKMESCKFAYMSYNKILIQLKTYFRDILYDEKVFLTYTKVLDDIVVDLCPTINGMSDRYDKVFTHNRDESEITLYMYNYCIKT